MALAHAWTSAAYGRMPASEQAKLWGLREVGAVDQLPIMLKRMLGDFAKKPHVEFSDRGPGFYHRRWGTITSDYDAACHRHGFTPWAGSNAKMRQSCSAA